MPPEPIEISLRRDATRSSESPSRFLNLNSSPSISQVFSHQANRLAPTVLSMSPSPLLPALSTSPPMLAAEYGSLHANQRREPYSSANHFDPPSSSRHRQCLRRSVSPLGLHDSIVDPKVVFYSSDSRQAEVPSHLPPRGRLARSVPSLPSEVESDIDGSTARSSQQRLGEFLSPDIYQHGHTSIALKSGTHSPLISSDHSISYGSSDSQSFAYGPDSRDQFDSPNPTSPSRPSFATLTPPNLPPRPESFPPYVPSSFLSTGSPLPLPTSVQQALHESSPPLDPLLLSHPSHSFQRSRGSSSMSESTKKTTQPLTVEEVTGGSPSTSSSFRGGRGARGGGGRGSTPSRGVSNRGDGTARRENSARASRGTPSARGRILRSSEPASTSSETASEKSVAAKEPTQSSDPSGSSTKKQVPSSELSASRWATDEPEVMSTPPANRGSSRGAPRGRGRGSRSNGPGPRTSIDQTVSTSIQGKDGVHGEMVAKKENDASDVEERKSDAPSSSTSGPETDDTTTGTTPSTNHRTRQSQAHRTSQKLSSSSVHALSPRTPSINIKSSATKSTSTDSSPGARRVLAANDRVSSGSTTKPKMSLEELEAKMARMRIENEKLVERQKEIEVEKAEYEQEMKEHQRLRQIAEEKEEEKERAERDKKERSRMLQADVDAARAKSAALKMAAIQGRAWDQEKHANRKGEPRSAPNYPSASLPALVRDELGRFVTPPPEGSVVFHIGVKDDEAVWDTVEPREDDS